MEESQLDSFCNSTFWDANLTWNTDSPRLTPCFQKTVLVWIPSIFLWTFSSIDIYYNLSSKARDIPWNWRNVSRLSIVVILIFICIFELFYNWFQENVALVDIVTPVIKAVTLLLCSGLLYSHKKYGRRSSGVVFIFWFLVVVLGSVQFHSEIETTFSGIKEATQISYMILYILSLASFLLNFISDLPPTHTEYPKVENPSPEEAAPFPSRLTFSWFDSLAYLGFRQPLVNTDLWSMSYTDRASQIFPVFDKYWSASVKKNSKVFVDKTAKFSTKSGNSVDITGIGKAKAKPSSILPALCKAFGSTFLFGAFLKFCQDLLTFVSPELLKHLIAFVESDEPQWRGFTYAVLLFVVATCQTLFLSQYFNLVMLVGLRIRTSLIAAIYRKALRLSNAARKESTVGEIVNLMSVDAQRFMDLVVYLNMIWSAPLQIGVALYFLWQTLGPCVLAGLGVMIFMIPLNGFIANRVKILQIKQMKNKDERVKMMNEILSGIKVLKLYAWEPSFEQQVMKIRDKEIKVLKQSAYFNASTSFIWSCAPFLVSVTTFAVYLMIDEKNVLDASKAFVALSLFNIMRMPLSMLPMVIVACTEVSLVTFATYVLSGNVLDAKKAFVALSLFNILRFPLSMLPMMISNAIQTSVSVKRINKFMNSEEIDPTSISHSDTEDDPLVMEKGTFSWGLEEEPTLHDINLRVKQGSLVAVVGTVGSGKSSLISAFLGEMDKKSGRVNIQGTIAYVPQLAWIQNATLQDNILFGRSLNNKSYHRVVEACALKQDLDMLPGGDQTEIGEKGINLSGGQKQRVSLARAVYSDCDIYFLDDPLSAVDSHVGKHIFESVISSKGMLRKKTRIFVTHSISFLPEVDQIVVLKEGTVSEVGTYRELLEKKGAFSEFLTTYLQEGIENDGLDELDSNLKEQILSSNPEIQRQLSRQKSVSSDSSSVTSLTRRKLSNSSQQGKEEKPAGEKLIEEEKAEIGGVKWEVYKHYLRSIGLKLSLATIILNIIYQGFSVATNLWLSKWASDTQTITVNGTQNTELRDLYLEVYGLLGLGQTMSTFLCTLCWFLGCIFASVNIHRELFSGVIQAPMSFYDTTQIGRILNRFASEISMVDNALPHFMKQLISFTFSRRLVNWSVGPESLIGTTLLLSPYHPVGVGLSNTLSAPGAEVVMVLFAMMAIYLGALRAAALLHNLLLSNILRVSTSFFDITPLGRVINRVAKDVDILDNVLPMTLRGLFSFVTDVLPRLGCWLAAVNLHKSLLSTILHVPLSFMDTTPQGRILARFSKDVDTLDDTLPYEISDGIYCLFEVIGTLFVISYSTPIFIAVILPIGLVYYFLQKFYVATSRQLKRLESVSRSPIYSHFGESVSGSSSIRAYNVQERFIRESEQKVDLNQVCTYPGMIANRWLAVRLEMVGNLIIFFSALFAVLGKDSLSPGIVGLSVSYALQITQTLNWLVRMTAEIETNIVAVERIKEYVETPQEAPWEISPCPISKEWPEEGKILFSEYQVRYRKGLDLVLKGISFSINGGEKVGIVGRTGAGKSSLTLSLFRIIEAAGGKILIDGVDIATLGLHSLRSRLTIIPQDPVLFSGTLRLNLDPFNQHSDEQIWRALELAHLKTFVKGLTAGLQHEVSEGGENLSVGQRQLICLARALLRKTKVLILDEATAAVDLETDDLIQTTIRSEFKHCTVLTIAHRLNTIIDSDRVLVLDKGIVAEFDSPSVLLKNKNSIFYGMAHDAGLV